jgi:hypothetical protein
VGSHNAFALGAASSEVPGSSMLLNSGSNATHSSNVKDDEEEMKDTALVSQIHAHFLSQRAF